MLDFVFLVCTCYKEKIMTCGFIIWVKEFWARVKNPGFHRNAKTQVSLTWLPLKSLGFDQSGFVIAFDLP